VVADVNAATYPRLLLGLYIIHKLSQTKRSTRATNDPAMQPCVYMVCVVCVNARARPLQPCVYVVCCVCVRARPPVCVWSVLCPYLRAHAFICV
jgi:hypothetical protein